MLILRDFQIFTSMLPGVPDPSVAIAGSRAGGIGILDLEYAEDCLRAQEDISKVSEYARNEFGIKLRGYDDQFLSGIISSFPQNLRLAILTYGDFEKLQQIVTLLHRQGLRVLLECTSLEQAQAGERLEVDGVIAKGQEAGGRVGNETTFILLQHFLTRLSLPVWAQGGVGVHTAAACYVAGAAGVLLDSQLAMTKESPIPDTIKARIAGMHGTETICIGEEIGAPHRVCSRLGMAVVKELQALERSLLSRGGSDRDIISLWHRAIKKYVGWDSLEHRLFLMGQDIVLASPLAQQFVTVGGVLEGIRQAIDGHCRAAHITRPLAEGSPLAQSHHTRYPIVQGPMAQVSDTPAFAIQVAKDGALPFLALSRMHGTEIDCLLQETRALLGERAWGIGLLGFLDPVHYREQLTSVIAHRPPFAMIAGGRSEQAKALEAEGIAAYLHVPTAGLLRMFLESGTRRFVFEGRESGGHVGPLCSFVLWETMIDELLKPSVASTTLKELHVLFAGGIHDALSAAMVAVMSSPLTERGVRVGVQLGSAYLITDEAVATGAITKRYQQEAIQCGATALLESRPGHAIRCTCSHFTKEFRQQKLRLAGQGLSNEEIGERLEQMNLGRLRIASKGIARNPQHEGDPQGPRFGTLSEADQIGQGIYMIGELAALRDRSTTISTLHEDISVNGSKRIEEVLKEPSTARQGGGKPRPSDIGIIGMACLFPNAADLRTYWENIVTRVSAVREIPQERWDWRLYYDPNSNRADKIDSKWGGFLEEVPFDPTLYGMPPKSLSAIEPLQLLSLEVTKWALKDAGYLLRPFPREHTSVIFGISGVGELGHLYSFRTLLPRFFGEGAGAVVSRLQDVLPEWTEDSFPGILTNVTAGRIANRFNLGGTNCSVDAACASSLAAVYWATQELEARASDMVIVGGADCMQDPFTYMCFSKTKALSKGESSRPLDESADGIVIGEGIAVMILKRLEDAERDGDRIYAIIKGIGSSSDGRERSMSAPSREGQMRALRRAYVKAGISAATVELIEAHATGTAIGDRTEIEALSQVFKDEGAASRSCAIGSIKSMLGHTKSAAGLASLLKTTLALRHKVLPPTMGVEKPNLALSSPDSPFYPNTEARPWIRQSTERPRRAGVNAFGFGGTNFHAVLEEYRGEYLNHQHEESFQRWPSELLCWQKGSHQELLDAVKTLEEALRKGARPTLADLAFALSRENHQRDGADNQICSRLAVVANSLEDLQNKLRQARESLVGSHQSLSAPRGIYLTAQPLSSTGKVAFLFPGQGSQYVNMLADLTIQFPEIQTLFEQSNRVLEGKLPRPLSSFIFPPSSFSDEEREACQLALANTHVAQPAVGTVDLAMFHLLRSLGVQPDMVAGHSYGEYVALCAAGVFSEEDLIALSEARARFMGEEAGSDPGTMAAIFSDMDTVAQNLTGLEGVWIANVNAPKEIVISGLRTAVDDAVQKFGTQGIRARRLPVSCAFHSPIMAGASGRLKKFLTSIKVSVPKLAVFSNTTTHPYPAKPQAITKQLMQHLVSRVEFVQEIEEMYRHGARIFVEVGPGRVLSGLVDRILGDRPHLAAASDQSGRSGVVQLQHLLGQLMAQGVPVNLEKIFRGRALEEIDLKNLEKDTHQVNVSPTTWLVNGSKARPWKEGAMDSGETGIEAPFTVAGNTGVQSYEPSPSHDRKKSVAPMAQNESGSRISANVKKPDIAAPQVPRSDAMSSSGNGLTEVMLQHQRLMQRFLETQKSVMMHFLRQATSEAEIGEEKVGEHLPMELSVLSSSQAGIQKAPSPEPIQAGMPESSLGSNTSAPRVDASAQELSATASPLKGPNLLDREAITSCLLKIVSERTGYPVEMLDFNVDLEADLGIDSIKKVEITGLLLQQLFPGMLSGAPEEMEEFVRFKTLKEILDRVEGYTQTVEKREPADMPSASSLETSAQVSHDQERKVPPRCILAAANAPLPLSSLRLAPERVLIVTDDGRGIASALIEKLECQGARIARVRMSDPIGEAEDHCYRLQECSAESVAELLETIRKKQGPCGGLIHLLPLRKRPSFEALNLKAWQEALQVDVKVMFYFLKLLENDLQSAAKEGGSFVVAATGMGGEFASDPEVGKTDFFPGEGGIHGLLKTVALEWPEVHTKTVDLCLTEPISDLADHLMAEIGAKDSIVEVGYKNSRRLRLDLIDAPLNFREELNLRVDSSWVILVTGGARGITAAVTLELAKRYRPTLILMGRAPLPAEKESGDTAGLISPQELKGALIAARKRRGEPVSLGETEAAYRQLLKEREIRANLAAMREAGATVSYVQVDVQDERSFEKRIDEIYGTYGRLDGVIHGAGIIEDKLLRDKSVDSFDRVFGTKTDSAFILSRKLRPETLQLLVLFSSVAGRFGNRGQSDYTAANDVINKLAIYLDARWPGRVVAINWGPWETAGMVSREVQNQFATRGVGLVAPAAGAAWFDLEIHKGRKGEAEVVLGDGPWRNEQISKGISVTSDQFLPLIQDVPPIETSNGSLRITKRLDPSHDLYLNDHLLDGKPVFPAAMAIELMAEAAQVGWPQWMFSCIKDVRVFKGIVFNNGARDVKLVVHPERKENKVEVDVRIMDVKSPGVVFYKGTVILSRTLPLPEEYELPTYSDKGSSISAREAYERWLFHGPRFQRIQQIEAIDKQGMLATVMPSLPKECLASAPRGQWQIDPILLDNGLQLALIWARANLDITPLPASIGAVRLFKRFDCSSVIRCYLQVLQVVGNHSVHGNVFYTDRDGSLLVMMEGIEVTGSKSLNRLAGQIPHR
jgi:acyl transferase domain-containing protein/NAD(P)H-dependent flavin oxidoreductase YrpB (nitropropane dioxygenase family)/NAD(P)-dependent dehydrogenase (short-subunit alcohol dehydrogenase family)